MSRRENRRPLTLKALCRTAKYGRPVVLTDLSVKGCRLEMAGLDLVLGQSVTIKPEGLEGLLGTVRWVEADSAGIEFDYPLYPAVVDHLCRIHNGDG